MEESYKLVKPAPKWAERAKILSAIYDDIPYLKQARDEFGATTLILYHSPEITNGWCPRGTWQEVEEFIEKAHHLGLKVICYYDTTLVEESFFNAGHKDWVQRNEFGEPQHYQPEHIRQHRYALCFNSPWSEYVCEIAVGYMKRGADGIFLDNPDYYNFTGKSCFCPYCREKFVKEKGKDIFSVNEEERISWLGKCFVEHLQRVYEAIFSVSYRGSFVFTCNISGNTPVRNVNLISPYVNVIFRELSPLNRDEWEQLKNEKVIVENKPIWIILTEGIKGHWVTPEDAAKDIEKLCKVVKSINACPMIWSTLPTFDPDRPPFGNISIYNSPSLGNVVKKCFKS